MNIRNRHKLIFVLVLLAGIALPYLAISQDKKVVVKERKLNKRFDVNPSDTLAIVHSFGNVYISTWDKNEIAFDIKITGTSDSEARSLNIINNVDFKDELSKGLNNKVTFTTKVATPYNNNNGVNGREVRVDLVVHIPEKMALNVQHFFGDVYLGDFAGFLKLEILCGHYHIQNLVGASKSIQVQGHSHSDSDINTIVSIDEGRLSCSDGGKLVIGRAKDITIWGYDSLAINSVESACIYRHAGIMSIASVGKLYGNIEGTNVVIGELRKTAALTITKCGNFTIRSIGPDFNVISISASESGLACHIVDGANFEFDVNMLNTTLYGQARPAFVLKNEEHFDQETGRRKFFGSRGSGSGVLMYRIEGGVVNFY